MDANLERLQETGSWEWPPEAKETLLAVLRDDRAGEDDLALACRLAGDLVVMDDEVAEALLAVLHSGDKPERARGQAAIGLGPALELVYTDGLDDPGLPVSERTFDRIQDSLRTVYQDPDAPKEVRRRALEASVRARRGWHLKAIETAYASDDPAWRLTAVFCMRHVPGYEKQILEALGSEDPDIHYEAVIGAGTWQVDAAWPHVVELLTSDGTDKALFLAAIQAAAGIRPDEAPELLGDLIDHHDEDVAGAAYEALAMAEAFSAIEGLEEDDEDLDEDLDELLT